MALERLAGRAWVYALLGLAGMAFAYVHGWWLPRRGINGWTAEPYDRYLALVTRDARAESS